MSAPLTCFGCGVLISGTLPGAIAAMIADAIADGGDIEDK